LTRRTAPASRMGGSARDSPCANSLPHRAALADSFARPLHQSSRPSRNNHRGRRPRTSRMPRTEIPQCH
jgi:hypothetical protein